MARKTTGWDDAGKQLYQTIGYFEKRDLAMQALADFNKDPYSVEVSTVTFSDIFDQWKENKFEDVSRTSINGYNAAFTACITLHAMKFVDIRAKHMQNIIRTCDKGHGMLRKIKVLFNQLFKFAMENDIVNKDYATYVVVGKNTEDSSRKAFSDKEIKRLFDVVDNINYADTILIMIYTGLRIGELIILKPEDVDLKNRTITGGIKTDAGKNRIVPISNKIYDMVARRVLQDNEYLIARENGKQFKYSNYYKEKFTPIMEQLNFKHKPHDCRHTFATLMSNAGADTIALQKIIGHASYETTANIYTHKDIDQLKKAVDLI